MSRLRAFAAPAMGALTAAMVLSLAACSSGQPVPEPVRPVQLVQVRADASSTPAVLAGEVRPRFETDLGFRVAGKVLERRVDIGMRVRRGETLAKLDPADVGLQVQGAQAALRAAAADDALANAEWQRYQDLFAQKFISTSALDTKRSAFDAAHARLEQARAQLAQTQNQADYATLTAPEDGVITAVAAEVGQVVSVGQPVFRLARESEREVAISVPENRLREVQGAKSLVVTLWADPGKVYPARIREIAPAVDPATRTFAVRLSVLEADSNLRLGMTAQVGVLDGASTGAMLVPLSAIYHANDGAPALWVYAPESHSVALRPVHLGPFREDGALIVDGVAPGDWIVAAGVNKLAPGQVVRPYDTTRLAAPGAPAAGARS
jgi:RND family efflux transporter MFP subunit